MRDFSKKRYFERCLQVQAAKNSAKIKKSYSGLHSLGISREVKIIFDIYNLTSSPAGGFYFVKNEGFFQKNAFLIGVCRCRLQKIRPKLQNPLVGNTPKAFPER